MTRREIEEARIRAITERLIEELDLGWLDIEIHFQDWEEDADCIAKAVTEWEYRSANIVWYIDQAMPLEDDAIERHAIHELVHVMLGPVHKFLKGKGKRALEELATQNVAFAIHAARRR